MNKNWLFPNPSTWRLKKKNSLNLTHPYEYCTESICTFIKQIWFDWMIFHLIPVHIYLDQIEFAFLIIDSIFFRVQTCPITFQKLCQVIVNTYVGVEIFPIRSQYFVICTENYEKKLYQPCTDRHVIMKYTACIYIRVKVYSRAIFEGAVNR